MKQKTLFLHPNPEFDKRFQGGISRLYQIFCQQYGYNLEIVNLDFLKQFVPENNYSQVLVIAGGDGTIHKVINTIPDEAFDKYIFGIIPAGTANEFAKSLYIPISLIKSACFITEPKKIYYQHIGVVNNQYKFVTGLLYGIEGKILQATPTFAKHFLGTAAFPFGMLRIFNRLRKTRKKMIKKFRIKSKEFRTNYLLINNASLISKNISNIDLQKESKDLFSLIYLHSRLKIWDIIRLLSKYHVHYHILDDPIIYFEQLSEVTLEFEDQLEFALDGDPYYLNSPLNLKFYKIPVAFISG